MVSKEPNQLITGHTNSKGALADKLPGTMTVRSVLLNRDSPDIESRLKRRRNRPHQVRFKDLEDGSSSSSGNGGAAETKSRQRCGADRDSPHPFRKHSGRVQRGWADQDGSIAQALPGRTSVVGAVRGDMAGTIEVVAAFLARAPPHPLTPGPTRRCWAPPQANSLTLPMTRKSSTSTSTSTAIQTSPCLKKSQSHTSTRAHSQSLGDSVGVDGDDEQDSQDENLTNNRVSSAGPRKEVDPPEPRRQQAALERKTKDSRSDDKTSTVVVRNPRHSLPSSILHHAESCHCPSVSCREVSKRPGSTTPSLVRRRKRLNRAISDPGKEVSFCTTPTQTDRAALSLSPEISTQRTQVCIGQVQTESPISSPPLDEKQCTTQSKTECYCPSQTLDEKCSTIRSQTGSTSLFPPPDQKHCMTPVQTESPCPSAAPVERHSTNHSQTTSCTVQHCNVQIQTKSSCPPPPPDQKHCATQIQTKSSCPPPPPDQKHCATQIQTKSSCPPPPPDQKHCATQIQTKSSCPPPPPDQRHCATQIQTKSSCPPPPPDQKHCATQIQTKSSCLVENIHPAPSTADEQGGTPKLTESSCSDPLTCPPHPPGSTQVQTEMCSSQTSHPSSTAIQPENSFLSQVQCQEALSAQINTVPYLTTPPTTITPTLMPHNVPSPCPPLAKLACATPRPSSAPSPSMSYPSSALTLNHHFVPYHTVMTPPEAAVVSPSSATCLTENDTAVESRMLAQSPTLPRFSASPTVAPDVILNGPTVALTTAPNANVPSTPLANQQSNTKPPTNASTCTLLTQTALSCTSISYYATSHPAGGTHSNSTLPPYATLIQTVSHCKIPCQTGQPATHGITYSSPVPKLKSCTSPPLLDKTCASTLHGLQSCATPSKTAPLYSSTFRAAPPYTPPSQDQKGVRLPPPPAPPPPYTPRKQDSTTLGPANRPNALGADCDEMEKEKKKVKENGTETEPLRLCRRANSLKHRAPTPLASVIKGEKQSCTLPAKACSKPSCLSSAQAQLGALHKMLCSGASVRANTPNSQHPLPPSQQGCSGSGGQPTVGPLSASQAETLRQVQEILGGLVSGARCKLDPSRVTEKLLGPNGPLHDIRSLQTQLQSLEGVLETSQNTIKVLLDVIQDLEKKEAERDGRHSYRTGQDIENCGTCRDCACIIYSVEHDFRLQEGQVVRTWKVGDPPEDPPEPMMSNPSQPSTPHRQEPPQPAQPPATTKKNRKKCFWFL